MSKATTKATQAAPVIQAPETLETFGVQRYWTVSDTTLVLQDQALSKMRAALAAIRACNDLLNCREMARHAGETVTAPEVAHGLMAAIDCAAELLAIHIDDDPEGAYRLRGRHAEAVNGAAACEWYAARCVEGGQQ